MHPSVCHTPDKNKQKCVIMASEHPDREGEPTLIDSESDDMFGTSDDISKPSIRDNILDVVSDITRRVYCGADDDVKNGSPCETIILADENESVNRHYPSTNPLGYAHIKEFHKCPFCGRRIMTFEKLIEHWYTGRGHSKESKHARLIEDGKVIQCRVGDCKTITISNNNPGINGKHFDTDNELIRHLKSVHKCSVARMTQLMRDIRRSVCCVGENGAVQVVQAFKSCFEPNKYFYGEDAKEAFIEYLERYFDREKIYTQKIKYSSEIQPHKRRHYHGIAILTEPQRDEMPYSTWNAWQQNKQMRPIEMIPWNIELNLPIDVDASGVGTMTHDNLTRLTSEKTRQLRYIQKQYGSKHRQPPPKKPDRATPLSISASATPPATAATEEYTDEFSLNFLLEPNNTPNNFSVGGFSLFEMSELGSAVIPTSEFPSSSYYGTYSADNASVAPSPKRRKHSADNTTI
jgi:hypothetical protein